MTFVNSGADWVQTWTVQSIRQQPTKAHEVQAVPHLEKNETVRYTTLK